MKMNNLVVDEVEYVAKDFEGIIKVIPTCFSLTCEGKNKLCLQVPDACSLEIFLADKSSLEIEIAGDTNVAHKKIEIVQHNDTKLDFRYAFSSDKEITLNVVNVIKGNGNSSRVQIRNIAYGGRTKITVLADVAKNTKDNEIVEDLKGIEYGGKIEINPDMQIYTNEVVANHFVTIGT
ncbi:MAG: hypothetical protein K2M17_03060, partial [Bacilli bacterium]|nr:hypothetical protein [Bacilli bacterium]